MGVARGKLYQAQVGSMITAKPHRFLYAEASASTVRYLRSMNSRLFKLEEPLSTSGAVTIQALTF